MSRFDHACHCGKPWDVYAMDKIANGWGDYFCFNHLPDKFIITDTFIERENKWATEAQS